MNAFNDRHAAVDAARVLMTQAGLTDEEANAFLDRIAEEMAQGRMETEDTRLQAIERALSDIREQQRNAPGRLETNIAAIGTGLITSALYDAFKSEPAITPAAPCVLTAGDARTTIQVDWAGGTVKIDTAKIDTASQIEAMRRALRWHEEHYGVVDNGTAISLDGLAMFLDREKRHREAIRLRHQALKITQRIHGRVSESTAAALSNIALTLFAQGKYHEGNQYLTKSLRIMIEAVGQNHVATAAVIYNCYVCFRAQGHLRSAKLPQQFLRHLPQIRDFANVMAARKYAIVVLLVLIDCCRALKEAYGLPWKD